MGYHINSAASEGVETFSAISEKVDLSISCEAYVLRQEKLITDGKGMNFTPAVSDGQRVRVGDRLADVYTGGDAKTRRKIKLLEEQIDFYKECAESHATVGNSSAAKEKLYSLCESIRLSVANGEISDAVSQKDSTFLALRKLGVLTGSVSDFNSVVTRLEGELSSLKASLGSVTYTVNAPTGGYYFSEIDGYEEIFAFSDVDSITYTGFMESVEKANELSEPETDYAGKLVSDFRWYVVARMTAKESVSFKSGEKYTVTLSANRDIPVDMESYKVLTYGTEALVLFKCDRFPENFDYKRLQNASVTETMVECFSIPTSAIRVQDGFEGVFIVDDGIVKFRRVEIIGELDGFKLCRTPEKAPVYAEDVTDTENTGEAYLQINDIVIKKGTGIYDGMPFVKK